jgi:hypothetical protein
MFGVGKKAKPYPRDQRNPNYAQVFYPLLEAHARVLEAGDHAMSLSRNEYQTLFGAELEEKYIKCKAERNATTYPFFAMISIGQTLFALVPGLSQHGLQEVEQISRSVIREIMDHLSGASIGMAHRIKLSLSSQPVSFGVYSACSDFLKEVDRKWAADLGAGMILTRR